MLAHLQAAQATLKQKLAKEPASLQPDKNFKISHTHIKRNK